MGEAKRKRKPSKVRGVEVTQVFVDEPVAANDNEAAPVQRVESVGLDLNRYALERIIPGAAEMCLEGQQREIAAERDVPLYERKVFHCVELRPGVYETTTPLPYGLPALRVYGDPIRFHWEYRQALVKYRVCRDEEARKRAGGNGCAFIVVGGA